MNLNPLPPKEERHVGYIVSVHHRRAFRSMVLNLQACAESTI